MPQVPQHLAGFLFGPPGEYLQYLCEKRLGRP